MYTQDKPYTLITGASKGLGKAMAIACASRGMNLVIVASHRTELQQLGSFIRRRYDVKVCEFDLDLSQRDSCILLCDALHQNNISINMLINNAGIGSTVLFEESKYDMLQKQIEVNAMATVQLTHLFLPELKKHQRSYILNVSSLCVFFYLAKKQVYGATKSFIYYFSKSLRKELKQYGVSVSVLCPGGMNSTPIQWLLNRKGGFFQQAAFMNPEDVAPLAIDGLLKGKERIIPGRLNKTFMWLDKLLPAWLKNKMTLQQMKKLNTAKIEKILRGENTGDDKKAA